MHQQSSSTSKRKRCIIGGFMGTGKTTVGRLLAKRAGVPFFDMDTMLVEKWGEIHLQFQRDGEAVFREREAAVAMSLAHVDQEMIVATGGGVFAVPALLKAFQASAITVSLTATLPTLSSRVQGGGNRPLWNAEVEKLFLAREKAYAAADYVVDTEGLRVEAVVEELFDILNRV